jgi:hypothetical protein
MKLNSYSSSSTKIAGALMLISVAAIASAQVNADDNSVKTEASQAANINLEKISPPSTEIQSQTKTENVSAGSTATVQTNSSAGGGMTSQVTINGEPVDMPANGTTQQTVSDGAGGQTTITVTNSQGVVGDASNSNFTHTSLNVSSNSVSSGTSP